MGHAVDIPGHYDEQSESLVHTQNIERIDDELTKGFREGLS